MATMTIADAYSNKSHVGSMSNMLEEEGASSAFSASSASLDSSSSSGSSVTSSGWQEEQELQQKQQNQNNEAKEEEEYEEEAPSKTGSLVQRFERLFRENDTLKQVNEVHMDNEFLLKGEIARLEASLQKSQEQLHKLQRVVRDCPVCSDAGRQVAEAAAAVAPLTKDPSIRTHTRQLQDRLMERAIDTAVINSKNLKIPSQDHENDGRDNELFVGFTVERRKPRSTKHDIVTEEREEGNITITDNISRRRGLGRSWHGGTKSNTSNNSNHHDGNNSKHTLKSSLHGIMLGIGDKHKTTSECSSSNNINEPDTKSSNNNGSLKKESCPSSNHLKASLKSTRAVDKQPTRSMFYGMFKRRSGNRNSHSQGKLATDPESSPHTSSTSVAANDDKETPTATIKLV